MQSPDHNDHDILNWISQLPSDIEERVRGAMSPKLFKAGESIYRYGEEADATYQVVEGSVQTNNVTAEGKELLMHIMMPGECFGEIGLIEGSKRAQNSVARGDTLLSVLKKSDFNHFRSIHPEINAALLKMQCGRLRMTFLFMEDSALRTLRQRLARRLILMATMGGAKENGQILIKLALSQEELGKMLGASRQSINKELSFLEKEGIVEKTRSGIAILNPHALNSLT